MTKWTTHDDVADVSLCGLDSFTLFFLPTFFPPHPLYTLRFDTRRFWVMSSLLSRCSYNKHGILLFKHCLNLYTEFFLSSSHVLHIFLSLLGLSSPIQMQRRPHRLFVSSILEVAIHARFSFQQRVGDRKLNSVCALRTCTLDLGSFFYRRAVNAPHLRTLPSAQPSTPPNPDSDIVR